MRTILHSAIVVTACLATAFVILEESQALLLCAIVAALVALTLVGTRMPWEDR